MKRRDGSGAALHWAIASLMLAAGCVVEDAPEVEARVADYGLDGVDAEASSDGGEATAARLNPAPTDAPPSALPEGTLARLQRWFVPRGDHYWAASGPMRVATARDGSVAVHLSGGAGLVPVQADPFVFQTQRIARGDETLEKTTAAPQAAGEGKVAIAHGPAVEGLELRPDGLEQTWAFAQAPQGVGDLTIDVAVRGPQYAGQDEAGHHFVDPVSELGAVYGPATWVDADGERFAVTVVHHDGTLTLTVPQSVLDKSRFPAVLDPVIGPEFSVDESPAPGTGEQFAPAIAWHGKAYLVAWQDKRTGTFDIMGALVERDGDLHPTGPFVISSGAGERTEPAIAAGPSGWLVTWTDARSGAANLNLYGARVGEGANVYDPSGIAISTITGHQRYSSAVYDGSNYFVVWEDWRAGNADIRGSRVTTAGTVLNPAGIVFTTTTLPQRRPDIATGGGRSYVVWEHQHPSVVQAFGTSVTPAGLVEQINGHSLAGSVNVLGQPVVASRGIDEFMIVWTEIAQIRGRIIDGASNFVGTDFDISPTIGNNETDPDVTSDGTNYLVAWTQTTPTYDVHGALVNPAGTVLDGPFAIGTTVASELFPAVAAAARGFWMVAFTDTASGVLTRARPIGNDCCTTSAGPGCLDWDVQSCVCSSDAYCCGTAWDGVCVGEVGTLGCGAACVAAPCCTATTTPGCAADPVVEACVCAGDSYCCGTAWDSICVGEVTSFGCGTC